MHPEAGGKGVAACSRVLHEPQNECRRTSSLSSCRPEEKERLVCSALRDRREATDGLLHEQKREDASRSLGFKSGSRGERERLICNVGGERGGVIKG